MKKEIILIVQKDGIIKTNTEENYSQIKKKITKVVFEEGIKEIPDFLCAGCKYLTEVIIPDSVLKIGNFTFADCDGIVTIQFGTGIQYIGEAAFLNCKNMKGNIILDNIIQIGCRAFENCSSLSGQIILGRNIQLIDAYSFYQCTNLNINLSSLQLEQIEIGTDAFTGCTGIIE